MARRVRWAINVTSGGMVDGRVREFSFDMGLITVFDGRRGGLTRVLTVGRG